MVRPLPDFQLPPAKFVLSDIQFYGICQFCRRAIVQPAGRNIDYTFSGWTAEGRVGLGDEPTSRSQSELDARLKQNLATNAIIVQATGLLQGSRQISAAGPLLGMSASGQTRSRAGARCGVLAIATATNV